MPDILQGKRMRLIRSPREMNRFVHEQKQAGKTVGFVPTMGYLHEGHLSLLREAAKKTDCVVASIFVNPTQFGDREDYLNYPQDSDHDRKVAEKTGVAALFLPNAADIYPNGSEVTVKVNARTDVLCGRSRPGHFDGVATVLTKLFHIVEPDQVFFGMKDAQQVAVVSALIEAFHFPIRLNACPIVREVDGLAKSSRNVHLNAAERAEARHISLGLQAGLAAVEKGERRFDAVIQQMTAYYAAHLKLGKVDYVDVLNYPELKRNHDRLSGRLILACAVRYTKARLIDNRIIDTAQLSAAARGRHPDC